MLKDEVEIRLDDYLQMITYMKFGYNITCRIIVITFCPPSRRGKETTKGPFGLRMKLPPAHLSTTQGGGFARPFDCLKQ